jgi:energy-coupling factor transporter ATP-binding protein EcfA2
MPARVGERLRAARHRWFVGREAERELFRSALTAPDLPFCLLVVHGPGGVGKSSLLGEFAGIAAEAGAGAYLLDGRNVDPAPDAFIHALRSALALTADEDPLDVLAARPGRHALLIDTFEVLAPLDGWLRDRFLPHLPDNTLVVLAGRQPLGEAWRADPGWKRASSC